MIGRNESPRRRQRGISSGDGGIKSVQKDQDVILLQHNGEEPVRTEGIEPLISEASPVCELSGSGFGESSVKKLKSKLILFVKSALAAAIPACRNIGKAIKAAALRVLSFSSAAFDAGYRVSYITGIYTMRITRSVFRNTLRVLRPAGKFITYAADRALLKHVRSAGRGIAGETVRFARGFPIAFSRVKSGFSAGIHKGIIALIQLPYIAVRRHSGAIVSTFNIAAPAAAVTVLVFALMNWTNTDFAIMVEYNGDTFGAVSNAAVYDGGVRLAMGSVNNADNSFEVRQPTLSIAISNGEEKLSEAEVCDRILKSSGDQIMNASGLYIDGVFEAAVASRNELDGVLDSILNVYKTKAKDEQVKFARKVEIVDGIYPISTIKVPDEVESRLKSTVQEPDSAKTHPYLQVNVVRVIEYTELIPFSAKTVQDTNQYLGYSNVKTAGKNGERKITAEVTLLDGVEQSRTVLSTVVSKQPVDKVTVIGAKKVNPSSTLGDGKSNGKFIWPLPSCKEVSSHFGWRGSFHSGMDISGNGVMGKPVIAADGGKVVESGWHRGGYGYYVIIDHGSGYKTLYAHCSALLVQAGQKVSQGQQIAKAGSTGNSTGAHLHFEIRINGTSVNPYPYVK